MAKIVLGAAVQDIRGTLNGSVYSRNKGGAYVRTKVSPVQPRTDSQLAQREIFANNAKAWSTLTDTQRAAWTAFAQANPLTNVFGAAIVISGLAAYTQLNSVLGTIGYPLISDPPADKSVPALAAPTGLTVNVAGPGPIQVTTLAQAVVANAKYYVFCVGNLQPGITPGRSRFRFVGAYAASAASTDFDISTAVLAKFGDPIAGKRYSVLVASVNTDTGAVTVGQLFTSLAS